MQSGEFVPRLPDYSDESNHGPNRWQIVELLGGIFGIAF
jgi:hypothetical protein